MADWNGPTLRRRLCSAERLSERAMAAGEALLKTLGSRSSALLPRVTAADHFFAARFDGARVARSLLGRACFPAPGLLRARGPARALREADRFTCPGLLIESLPLILDAP
jgi:hypothetical protein